MTAISSSRSAGALMFAAGMIFFIFNTIAESVYPGYSVKTNALSDLGAIGANTRFLWDGQLLIVGALSFIGTYLFFYKSSYLNISRRSLTGMLFLLPSIGMIVVSLVPENLNVGLHTLGAFVNFLFGGITAIYAFRFITNSNFRYFSLALGIISLGFTPLLSGSDLLGFGGVERLVVYPLAIWGLGFGSYLMQSER